MWILEQEHIGERKYILNDRNVYTIGRMGTDIQLSNDSSISRHHANIHVVGKKLFLEDQKSRFGTFYYASISSCIPIKDDERREMRAGDRVLFGRLKSKFIVLQKNYHVLASSVSVKQQNDLQAQLKTLGGTIEEQPSVKCTHVTMSEEMSLTAKLLYAVIKNIPIVTCDFWTQTLLAIKERRPLPHEKEYLPKTNLPMKPDATQQRAKLFENRVFIFLDKHMCKTYKPIVEAAGGKVDVLAENYKQQVLQPHIIVMEFLCTTETQNSQLFNEVSNFLQENGHRSIPDFEIAKAIMECDTRKWCNTLNELSEAMSACTMSNSDCLLSETIEESSIESIRVSESPSDLMNATQAEQSQRLLKRKQCMFDSDTDDDEDELVALSKRQHIAPNEREQRPVTPPPLEQAPQPVFVSAFRAHEIAKINQNVALCQKEERIAREKQADAIRAKNRANVRAKAEARAAARAQEEKTAAPKAGKRTRVAVLCDEEADNDLFEFCGSPEKRIKQNNTFEKQNSSSSDDELFKKPKPKPKEPMPEVESLFEFDLIAKSKLQRNERGALTEEATSLVVDIEKPSTSRAALTVRRAMDLTVLSTPIKFNTESWLQKTKTEPELKVKSEDTEMGMRAVPLDRSKTNIIVCNSELLNIIEGCTNLNDITCTNAKVFRKWQLAAINESELVSTTFQKL